MYLKIQVTPESKRSAITRVGADRFKINVDQKAVGNLANRQALSLLANHLRVPVQNLRIMTGHKTPHKIIHIRQ